MTVIETGRLVLRELTEDDAPFMLELLNDPAFIRNIGDRGVRSVDAARNYLREGAIASYARHGYGLYLVALKPAGEPIGICGLVKRDYLDDPDIGFAFLPGHRDRGYGHESAVAVRDHAFEVIGAARLLAITSPDNAASIGLLGKIGFRFERMIRPPGRDEEIRLFVLER